MGDERARFETARRAGLAAVGVGAGIGTLRERSLHAVLKYWADPDETHHEIPLEGLVADVFDGERVTEIQTRGFSKLRPKLARLLPRYPVTVIYPVAQVKRTAWIDPETGESTPLRRSPKTGRVWDAFAEMYYLRDYLRDYLLGGLRRDAGAGGLDAAGALGSASPFPMASGAAAPCAGRPCPGGAGAARAGGAL